METLTQPDSILPVRSRWQHSDKLLLNTFSKSLLSCSAWSKRFPPFWIPLWPIFRQRLTDLVVAQCEFVSAGSDKASLLTGYLWEVPLFLCLNPLWEAGVVVHRRSPDWTLECHTHIIASLLASRVVVTTGWLSPLLHPQHPFHSIAVDMNTKSEFGWKPWQWLVTTAVTRNHSHHCTGNSFCRQLHNHTVFLHWSLKMFNSLVFRAVWFCNV